MFFHFSLALPNKYNNTDTLKESHQIFFTAKSVKVGESWYDFQTNSKLSVCVFWLGWWSENVCISLYCVILCVREPLNRVESSYKAGDGQHSMQCVREMLAQSLNPMTVCVIDRWPLQPQPVILSASETRQFIHPHAHITT